MYIEYLENLFSDDLWPEPENNSSNFICTSNTNYNENKKAI